MTVSKPGGKIPSSMNQRRWIIGIGLIVLVVMVVLSSSLHDVHFKQGVTFAADAKAVSPAPLSVSQTIQDIPLWKLLIFWLVLVINLVLFIWLIPPQVRRRIIRQVFSFAIGLLALLFALRYRILQLPFFLNSPEVLNGQLLLGASTGSKAPEFHLPQMSPWMVYLISLCVLLVSLLLVWAVSRLWSRFQVRRSPLDDIASVASSSLDALAAGRNWGDVIIQSYKSMGEVISARRGLQRAEAMTPREFVVKLQSAGLPADAVARLTSLFESVRYGFNPSTPSQVSEAVACLNSILRACGTQS